MKTRKQRMIESVSYYPDGRREVTLITEAEYRRQWGGGMAVTGRMAKRLAEGTATQTPPVPDLATPDPERR